MYIFESVVDVLFCKNGINVLLLLLVQKAVFPLRR